MVVNFGHGQMVTVQGGCLAQPSQAMRVAASLTWPQLMPSREEILSESPSFRAVPLSQSLVPVSGAVPVSEPLQRFQQLLMQVEQLSAQLARLEAWSDRYRHGHVQALYAMAQEKAAWQERGVLFLHQRLQQADLTAPQQRQARLCIRQWLAALQPLQDPQLLALAEVYEEGDEGDDAPSAHEDEAQTEQRARAGWQQQQAQAQRKAAKRAARKAQRRPAAHQQAQQQQLDAKSAMRAIYRQLASALHPDREMVAGERVRKTALMGEVNAAYGRQDLTTLLRLQLEVAQVDAQHLSRLSADKLRAMSLLLKEQVQALTQDVWQLRMGLTHALGVPVDAQGDEADLAQALQRVQADERHEVDRLAADLARVQRDSELKRWLKEQALQAKQQAQDRDGVY